MLRTIERRRAIQTLHGWAISVLKEAGAIRECEEHCPCRKSNPDILVVQPAENWTAKNVPGPLDGARDGRILLQG